MALQAKREPIVPKPKAKPRDQTSIQKQKQSQSPSLSRQPQGSDSGPLDREDGAEPPVPIPFEGDHILECCEVSRRDALHELEGWCRSQQGSGLAAVVRCAGGGLSALGRQEAAAWPDQRTNAALGARGTLDSTSHRCAGGGLSALGIQEAAAWPDQRPDAALCAGRKIDSTSNTDTQMTQPSTSCLYGAAADA